MVRTPNLDNLRETLERAYTPLKAVIIQFAYAPFYLPRYINYIGKYNTAVMDFITCKCKIDIKFRSYSQKVL